MTRVGLIFGGRSGEHAVSIRSARAVVGAIDAAKHLVVPIAITEDGEWLDPARSAQLLGTELAGEVLAALPDRMPRRTSLVADKDFRGLTLNYGDSVTDLPLDVVFPVLHGTYGEDGTIQGLFEMADIPYVGCGVLASSCGMDKVTMKTLFAAAGLPICRYSWFLRNEWEMRPERVLDKIESELGFPCFVKPANLGSSVGVSGAGDREELRDAIALAAKYDRKIVVEESLVMREIECAVLGNDEPEASRPGEYVIRNKDKAFLDYTEKYAGTGNNEFVVPAGVDEAVESRIREMAIAAFKAIDGSGLARVDFFLVDKTGELLVNEINTMPGLTDASGYPKMWQGSGKTFGTVINDLIALAVERYEDRSRNVTAFQ